MTAPWASGKRWVSVIQRRNQRCWVHKTANILSALPKSVQPKVKAALHEIWMAQTRDEAYKAFDRALAQF